MASNNISTICMVPFLCAIFGVPVALAGSINPKHLAELEQSFDTPDTSSAAITATQSVAVEQMKGPLNALEGAINLGLSAPEYKDCGGVLVNGGVSGSDPISLLKWDWGDGKVTYSWFPAYHVYESDGQYTVTVSAVSDICATETASVVVNLSNAGELGCPAEKPQCAYLKPYNIHLTSGETGPESLHVVDHAGNPVTGSLDFLPGYDESLIAISPEGQVTALRQESPTEIGVWVSAQIDNNPIANNSVVRVLSQDYGIPFTEASTDNTVLYYPTSAPNFPGDLQQFVSDHQIAAVNEFAYQIQTDLLSSPNFLNGCRQVFGVDFGEGEQSRVCGLSGNPLRLGWNITGENYQNCFSGPHWFVYYHELGHNVTLDLPTFRQAFSGVGHYTEGLASVPSIVAMQRILADPGLYPLGQLATDSLSNELDNLLNQIFKNAFEDWLNAGAPLESLDANIVDAIWLEHWNNAEYANRFHQPMAPGNTIEQCPVWSQANALGEVGAHTYFAALVSAAANQDLSGTFTNVYHYPINQSFFDFAYSEMLKLIDGLIFKSSFE